jgi:hypothetical protein
MSDIPEDFKALLPKLAAEPESGPLYWLWVFDPHEDKVHLEHNEDRHPADHIDHSHLASRTPHPDRVHGYAYRIKGGFRVTDWEHRPVDDPHVRQLVERALRGEKTKPKTGSQVQSRAL